MEPHYGRFPSALHWVAAASLAVACFSALLIALDEFRRPQKMWIMNLVWPLTALFGGAFWLAAYRAWGRTPPGGAAQTKQPSMVVVVFKGTSHCGAGCTLGDIIAEWLTFAVPAIAVWFGWGSFFAEKTFADWIPDFILAFLFGLVFQYFTIKPMRKLSPSEGLLAALKADSASIAAWQIGMYGTMALIQFAWFRGTFGGIASVASPEFWFAMQLAMLAGFTITYPVNWLLVGAGWKEKM